MINKKIKAFVINLKERPERLSEFKQIKLPFDVEIFDAIKDDNGSLGCIKSHLACYNKFEDGINIIFEDDCLQISDINILYDALGELGDDWDVLYLGCMVNGELIDCGKVNVKILDGGWATHAIVYNGKKVSNFVSTFTPQEIKIRRRNIDTFLVHEVQKNKDFKCYITNPQIFIQKDGFSNIINEYRDNLKNWKF
jgi:hypothetical protein